MPSKHFEVQIRDTPSEIIEVRGNDTIEVWWRRNVANNRRGYVVLNGKSFPVNKLVDVKEVKPRKASINMEGV